MTELKNITVFPPQAKFIYPWRSYQKRVLDDLDTHLEDRHLHVVAPPGSGKTVLGLEVMLRINKPTLILAPTIAIRNQWIHRFCELFLSTNSTPDWISTNIREPKFMTVVTYQGLHAACHNKLESEEDLEVDLELRSKKVKYRNVSNIILALKKQGVSVVVVDEAHHLKNEWWHTLHQIKAALDPKTVGLTATPPYDVSPQEWHRYIQLNGPVDTEITVPELIAENDLCPHQDYVYMTAPDPAERDTITTFRHNIERLFQELRNDNMLLEAIQNHPIWTSPHDHLAFIYENLTSYMACLVFVHAHEIEIPETHLEVFGEQEIEIPALSYVWMEHLLTFYLILASEDFAVFDTHQEQLESRLRRYGAVEGKRISFSINARLNSTLSSSISKLEAIREITDFEYAKLGNQLRMVILGDYIRKEYFVTTPENNLELKKLGIIPIFEHLRRNNSDHKKLGVLTGSLVIIPRDAIEYLQKKAALHDIFSVPYSPVSYDANYIVISAQDALRNHIVHLVTELFQDGHIEVLIGTKSLLGEGWDAPSVNALILASFVGSFVLSNQMRGRAIRTHKKDPQKTSNVWHLACIDPSADQGGSDLQLMQRRFRSFVGVTLQGDPQIENGISRLLTIADVYTEEDIRSTNRKMISAAANRAQIRDRWFDALAKGVNLVEEIKIPHFTSKENFEASKSLQLRKSIAYLSSTLFLAVTTYLETAFSMLGRTSRLLKNTTQIQYMFFGIILVGLLYFGRKALQAGVLYLRFRDISKDVHHIGTAVLNTMIKSQMIQSDPKLLKVLSYSDESGAVYCQLAGSSAFERSTFINAMEEIISAVDNPRYIIIRKNKFLGIYAQHDYHAVPECFGKNAKLVTYFTEQWKTHVGRAEMVYTRSLAGRKLVLNSRIHSLSAQFAPEIEHLNVWR
ncbi:DEAD/DEAH box helicase family protein [Sphingobacterium corticibacter]|uniref:DEAD/DEAH box helicase family protein n=1 Tax=Sphingobacterium corticibacter TaxID=2171749 RepID=UPI001EF118F0|nr:DEAD/DEAH box helicase family protein [Sphingobacterium corticibacter]